MILYMADVMCAADDDDNPEDESAALILSLNADPNFVCGGHGFVC